MAGSKVNDYANDDTNIINLQQSVNKALIGKMSLTLTEQTTNVIPKIAAGSWAEVDGSLYKFDSDEAISTTDPVNGGTVADGTVYVTLIPSGSSVTAAFVDTDPTWNNAKQGYYFPSTSYRVVARCTKAGGTAYTNKATYLEKQAGLGTFFTDDDLYITDSVNCDDVACGAIVNTGNYNSSTGDVNLTNGDITLTNGDLTVGGSLTAADATIAGALQVTSGEVECVSLVSGSLIESGRTRIQFRVTKPVTVFVQIGTNFELTTSSYTLVYQIAGAGAWGGPLNPGYYELNGSSNCSLTLYGVYGSSNILLDDGIIVDSAT